MWQTAFGKCIYQTDQGIQVWQNPRYRWLTLGSSAIQTLIKRKSPEKPILEYIPALTKPLRLYPADFILFGLGGAGLLHYVQHSMPAIPGTVIEIDSEVIATAQQFFSLAKLPQLEVLCQSADDFLAHSKQQIKHLLIDIYGASSLPPCCLDINFYRQSHALLNEDGFLAMNIANGQEQLEVLSLIRAVFSGQTLIIPMKQSANIVVLAGKSGVKGLLADLEAAGQVKSLVWNKVWGRIVELKKYA